jgi:hypothetical protein
MCSILHRSRWTIEHNHWQRIGPGADRLGNLAGGGVSERPKERASKAREVQASAGSNPAATAGLLVVM